MTITIDQIKALREKTGISTIACKKALEETNGDETKAVEILRKKGEAKAAERAERSTNQGIVSGYIHSNNKLGSMVKLLCETDFVAKNEEFQTLGRDIAMHVAAMNPLYLSPEDIKEEEITKEREIWIAQLKNEKKPDNIIENILKGKEKKFREEKALLTQAFVKNPEITVGKLITDYTTKVGENIKVDGFTLLKV